MLCHSSPYLCSVVIIGPGSALRGLLACSPAFLKEEMGSRLLSGQPTQWVTGDLGLVHPLNAAHIDHKKIEVTIEFKLFRIFIIYNIT